MTLPAFFLGAVLATFYGAAFHLWRGGSGGRLLLYLFLAWLGFWVGQWLGSQFGWTFFNVGPLNGGMASLGAFALLGLGYWLSLVENY